MRAYRKVDDHYEFRIDGGRLALIGVGVTLVLLLVFLLGVLVGKGLWGGRRPVPIPLAEPRVETRREAPVPEAPSDKRRPELTFYDDLKRPDRPPAQEQEPAQTERPADTEESPAVGTKSAGTPPEASAPETRPTETPPVKTHEEASKPVARPEPKPRPKLPAPVFTVQVGSFRERAAAEDLARKMATQSVSAEVIQASVAGRTWYRVQVGRFETRATAERHYRGHLKSKGIQGFVTTR